MRILRARYRGGEELLRHLLPSLPFGGLFLPTRRSIAVGEAVIIEVGFPALRHSVMLRGVIAWRRGGQHRTKLRAGIGIEFLESELERRDFVLAVARGEIVSMVARRHRRLPVHHDVMWRVASDRNWFKSRFEDISPGGAFVATDERRSPGTELVLELVVPGSLGSLEIAARVVWVREQRGLGVEFRSRDAGGARRLRELVRRLEVDEAPAPPS